MGWIFSLGRGRTTLQGVLMPWNLQLKAKVEFLVRLNDLYVILLRNCTLKQLTKIRRKQGFVCLFKILKASPLSSTEFVPKIGQHFKWEKASIQKRNKKKNLGSETKGGDELQKTVLML